MIRSIVTALPFLALGAFCVSPVLAQGEKHAHTHAGDHSHAHSSAHAELPTLGIAVVMPTKGNKVRGVLQLAQKDKNIHVHGKIRNLTPGKHGFHIHEFGDLRNMADGTSAGGHFNPSGVPHGGPDHGHVGDLGNVEADASGVATVDITMKNTQLHFLLGRCFVVHADEDDLVSQPSGAAGPRVGLGLIGVGNPDFKAEPK